MVRELGSDISVTSMNTETKRLLLVYENENENDAHLPNEHWS